MSESRNPTFKGTKLQSSWSENVVSSPIKMKSSSNEAIATHGFSLQRLPDPQLFANFHLLPDWSSIYDVPTSSELRDLDIFQTN